MEQELEATARHIATIPHDELAAWVGEPIRSTMAMIRRFRAARDIEIAAWKAMSPEARALARLERRTKAARSGRSDQPASNHADHSSATTGVMLRRR